MNQKQHYTVWYGKTIVGQLLAPVETAAEKAREMMIDNVRKVPAYIEGKDCLRLRLKRAFVMASSEHILLIERDHMLLSA